MSGLAGKRVVVTRPREDADVLARALAAEGARPVLVPTIAIRPVEDLASLDAALETLADYAWMVVTSANAVAVVADRLASRGLSWPDGIRVAAVGSATAAALRARYLPVHFVPSAFRGAVLGAELPDVRGRRVLLPRAAIGRRDLADALRRRGAIADEVIVYDTLPTTLDAAALAALAAGVDAVTFTSASAVERFATLLGARVPGVFAHAVIACIGPVTGDAARALGLPVHVEPAEHTIPGLVRALSGYFARAGVEA